MISKIVLSNGEEFNNISDVYEVINNNIGTMSMANIILKSDIEVDINAINTSFSSFANEIKIYMKNDDISEEYLGATLISYANVRSVSKSYNSNSITISLSK